MRFYFHLRIGQQVSPDEIGLELPDLETAYLEAFQAAQDMWGELLSERSDPLLRSFEVADEHGQLLLTLPFKEVLDRARSRPPPGLCPGRYVAVDAGPDGAPSRSCICIARPDRGHARNHTDDKRDAGSFAPSDPADGLSEQQPPSR